MMKRRCVWAYLIVMVLAYFGWGGVAIAESEMASPAVQEQNLGSAAAQFVPPQAPLLVSLKNPKALPGTGPDTALSQWPRTLLTTAGVDYARDLQPWVNDEIAFALTGPVRQHSYLFALTTRGAKDSQACVEHLWQQQVTAGQTLNFEQYGNVGIISTQFSTAQPLAAGLQPFQSLATAIVDDRHVLLTNSTAVLQRVVDSHQGQSLAKTDHYRQAVTNLQQQQRDGFAYVDLAAFSRASTPPYHSLALQLGQTRQGVLAETVLVTDRPGTLVPPTVTQPIRSLDYIPASSPLVAAGVDLQQLWQQVSADLRGYDLLDQWIHRVLKQGGKQWSVNLSRDIFPAVTGEYAMAMVPSSDAFTATQKGFTGSDWLFVHEQSEANEELEQTLSRVAQQQNIGVIPYALADHQVSAWAHLVPSTPEAGASNTMVLNAEVTGAFATEADHKILATSLDALKVGLAGDAIAKQRDVQAALSALSEPNQGYLYLNWPVLRPLLERQFPQLRQLEQRLAPWSQKLTALTFTNYGETPSVQRSQMLLRFADS